MASSTNSPAPAPHVAAMAEWTCPEQQRQLYLGHRYPEPTCHVAFSMRFDGHTRAAFFKLRVPVAPKCQSKKTNIFVFVYPERISTLEQSTPSELPEAVRIAFPILSNNAILQLRFTLSTPCAIIVPAETPLAPKSAASVNLLRRVWSLTQATQLTVYFAAKGQPKHSLATMCELASTNKLKSDPSELRLETLYAGNGAKAIEGVDLVFPFDHEGPPESPPSYDELALPPPPRPQVKESQSLATLEPPRKKSRLRSPSPNPAAELVQKQALQLIRDELREEMRREVREQFLQSDEEWRKKMQEMRDEVRQELAQQLRDQAKEEVTQQIRDQIKEEVTQHVQAELQQLQTQHKERLQELEDLIEQRTESLREDLLQDIEAVADETTEIVDLRVDEQILNIKDELKGYMAEEIKDVEERIKDDIEQGEVSFQFTR
ncbi:centrosome-associated protein cep250 [Diplodia corticola]|uniref:Centrosome-associated protein cep250 n=1 Tax=Diplodia corticola TaxID=236234 RepID=A0A1J9R7F4_9PEZI|nr:centrosome-associated protein cep250 [Diplodia corticola]OJD36449.1 centrosome-associated protein cep250 [Diplodia corticola]